MGRIGPGPAACGMTCRIVAERVPRTPGRPAIRRLSPR